MRLPIGPCKSAGPRIDAQVRPALQPIVFATRSITGNRAFINQGTDSRSSPRIEAPTKMIGVNYIRPRIYSIFSV